MASAFHFRLKTPMPLTSAIGAFFAPFRGLALLLQPGLRRYVVLPLLVNILIFAVTAWIAGVYFDQFMAWALPPGSWLEYLEWLLWPLFVLTYLVAAFYSFTVVANLIASPFNGVLAARVEEKISGRLPPDAETGLMDEILPAIAGELGKLWYFVVRAVPVLILMVIPGIGAIGSLLWLLLGFWFLTIEYIDYPLGNHLIRPAEQRRLLRKHPLITWSFGAGSSLLMMIPLLNLAAMPASVAGATLLWVRNLR